MFINSVNKCKSSLTVPLVLYQTFETIVNFNNVLVVHPLHYPCFIWRDNFISRFISILWIFCNKFCLSILIFEINFEQIFHAFSMFPLVNWLGFLVVLKIIPLREISVLEWEVQKSFKVFLVLTLVAPF